MSASEKFEQVLIDSLPVRTLREQYYRKRFFRRRGWRNLHYGVFNTFAEAREEARRHHVVAHYELDHTEWLQSHMHLRLHDYPVLFWLEKLLVSTNRIVDLGGSVGVSYYSYSKRLAMAAGLEWLVLELPEVVVQGRAIAEQRHAFPLRFADSFDNIDGGGALLCAGALQFIEEPLPQLLQRCKTPPSHLLINRIPMREARGYVTLQNTGQAIAPSHVFCRADFLAALVQLGYVLEDEWDCLENSLPLPFHPELSVPSYTGLYLRKPADAGIAH